MQFSSTDLSVEFILSNLNLKRNNGSTSCPFFGVPTLDFHQNGSKPGSEECPRFYTLPFPSEKRKKRPEISRFQVFYGCGGRTRTCGLRVMSCSEAPIPYTTRVSRIFYPQKSRKTRRPDEFAPRFTSGLSQKWVKIWVGADSGVSGNGPLNQRRGFFSSA